MAKAIGDLLAAAARAADPATTAGMDATFQFVAEGEDGGVWSVRVCDNRVEVAEAATEEPDIVLTASADVWRSILTGSSAGRDALLQGALTLQGDVTLAMQLERVFGL